MDLYVLVSDFARYYVVVVSFWMLVLLGRLAAARIRGQGWHVLRTATVPPHVWTLMGFAGFMMVATARRFDNLGQPGDAYLWAVTVSATLMLIGAVVNWRFPYKPPHRR